MRLLALKKVSAIDRIMERFWEIDFLRGIAIIMMILFHLLFDIAFFTSIKVPVDSGFWFWFARATAAIFILLVGISLTISHQRTIESGGKAGKKFFKRGTKIFCYGLLITIITWIFFPGEFIIFGILHFIGISIIISQLFFNWKWKNLLLGMALFLSGLFLQNFSFNFPWLLWLGFKPEQFATFDYFPLLPWFGLVLIGLFAGNLLYPKAKRAFRIPELGKKLFARELCWLGKHSLAIYLLHQPILVAIMLILKTA
ncbi:MAG: heparan-alpha-glucosaminide N-acetyltransferase [Candidatus ainarchaeum sp.]|nr:heparan-alpha-glucosaminide N-acetyltransferase [Candidatus ainarchaeum sp.]